MNATKVNAGPAESNGRLLLGIWRDLLHVTCRLTACTPGSAPGPTLGNEYGKTLPFTLNVQSSLRQISRRLPLRQSATEMSRLLAYRLLMCCATELPYLLHSCLGRLTDLGQANHVTYLLTHLGRVWSGALGGYRYGPCRDRQTDGHPTVS